MKKIITMIFVIFLFIPNLFPQVYDRFSLDDFEVLTKETLNMNGYEYIVPRFRRENDVVNFYFNFLKVDKDEFYGAIGFCVAITAEITNKTSWTSSKAYFQSKFPNELLCWVYTKDCIAAMKIKDATKQGEYILSKLHWGKKPKTLRNRDNFIDYLRRLEARDPKALASR